MVSLKSLLTLLHFLAATASAATGINYLVNCASHPISEGAEYYRSEVAYYSDVTKSWDGEFPGAIAYFDWVVAWEGNVMTGTFPDGDTFQSVVSSDAAGLSTGAYAGFGANKYRQSNCYKDDQRQLYASGGDYCYSIY